MKLYAYRYKDGYTAHWSELFDNVYPSAAVALRVAKKNLGLEESKIYIYEVNISKVRVLKSRFIIEEVK